MSVTVGILAGGEGRRLGGRDKGLISIEGRTLVDRLCRTMADDVSEILICCNRNPHFYQLYADRILCETKPHGGPVAGMLALTQACASDWLAVLPCDQLTLPEGWLEALGANLANTSCGVYATERGRHTPVCLLNRCRATECIAQKADIPQSIRGFYHYLNMEAVETPGVGRDMDNWP